ncbi:hypothetical protein [Ralstonia sp. ASV6]|uniref:hypothetical protein n=1 Tax=Ralstonia sp. ASV6 TaxID=2795124 RepID=UPI0018EC0A46|nr:hypothetical protein [Ralstonia sp. ASV6]
MPTIIRGERIYRVEVANGRPAMVEAEVRCGVRMARRKYVWRRLWVIGDAKQSKLVQSLIAEATTDN